ncbi:BMP family protein [Kytococcus sedentarius]|uniref:BMP family lipoprotein n=1 Tax=Kytococcus sedentarius TaxID=1276 RepID=UPI0035BC407F
MRVSMKVASVLAAGALALSACGDAPEESGDETSKGTSAESAESGDATGDESAESGEGESGESGEGESGDAVAGEVDTDYKACMVSDQGGFDDQSFNQTSFAGLERAKEELGVQIAQVESSSEADFTPNVDSLVNQQNCNMIIGVGFMLEDAIQEAAKQHSDIDFALVDAALADGDTPTTAENVRPLLFNTAEAAFLGGYLAAGMSETGKVATFGGVQLPSVAVFMDGYADGVKHYNEAKDADVQVLGWNKESQEGAFSGDFENIGQGKTLTEQFLAQDVDVVMPVAGPVGAGAAQAVEGKDGAKLIWVDTDGYESTEYGDIIMSSVVKKMDEAVFTAVQQGATGSFDNTPYVGTVENEGVGLAPYHDFDGEVSDELKKEIEDLRGQIASGDLKVESENTPK